MQLSLRRVEIVIVFLVALGCSYFLAAHFFRFLPTDSSIYLIPQPAVTNEKEALLKALRTDAQNIPEDQKAKILHTLTASSSKAPSMSADDKLKMLEALRASSAK